MRLRRLQQFHRSTSRITTTTPLFQIHQRLMSSPNPTRKTSSVPHKVRTAAEPRQNRVYNVRLSHIEQASSTVRLLHLTIPPQIQNPEESQEADSEPDQPEPFAFLPGQWLDVHIPSISNAGGFSITSTPVDAQALPSLEPTIASLPVEDEETGLPPLDPRGRDPYVELAVQRAPSNPASAWLWQPKDDILGKELSIRVGGSFVWPPLGVDLKTIRNVVFVAGGVGINPLVSMLSHLNNNAVDSPALLHPPCNIHFLYSCKAPEENTALEQVLFLSRIRQIIRSHAESQRLRISLDLYLTNLPAGSSSLPEESPSDLTIHPRRINRGDLQMALSGSDGRIHPDKTVCYMCGPPRMTDEFVGVMQELLGQNKERVFFEKWW
ncbi:hypothetical protein FE257_004035 [Aspergillus nanangensis]|uniref:FAD-binding FR-type domain-containing protein n=1 Tax=Aspergillus nanangensis TaxID=2582783 RepID=A0AAD4GN89_ASPNN|nr:hypothetical protein FE257_004035 [Aspergillus nanangensis]